MGTWEGFVSYIHPSDHLTSVTISDMAGAYATRLGAWELENRFSERGNMKVGHSLAGAEGDLVQEREKNFQWEVFIQRLDI